MAIHRKSDAARNAKADAYLALFNGGTMEFRTGVIPATPATADSGTLLAVNDFAATAFGAAVAGVATVNALTENTQVGTGNIGHVRCKDSVGVVIADFDAGVGTEAIVLDKIAVATAEKVHVVSFTYTEPM